MTRHSPYQLPNRHEITNWKEWPSSELNPDVKVGDAVRKLGYEFIWTDLHRKGAELEPLRLIGDEIADAALEAVNNQPDQDTLTLVMEAAKNGDEACRAYMKQMTTVPAWVDFAAVERGQRVFVRHMPAAQLALLHLSLVGGFGAPKINKVLTSTGYLANKNTYRRLFETNQMIIDCLEPGAMEPLKGNGWNSCARVRFLHCKVRTRLKRSQKWNTAEWGVPINQEDMAVTVLAFQYNVLLVLDLIKIQLTEQEREDYTHLWRYIGYLMGVLDEYNACTSYARSKAYLESIVMHLIDPDETSRYLANHVINAVTDRPPAWWNYGMHAALARMLMGDHLANQLQLPDSKFYAAVHEFLFVIVRLASRMSYAPVIGERIMNMNMRYVKVAIKDALGGPASFTLSHAPADHQIGATKGFDVQDQKPSRWANPRLRLFLIILVVVLVWRRPHILQAVRRIAGLSR